MTNSHEKRDHALALTFLILLLAGVAFYFQRQAHSLTIQLSELEPIKAKNVKLEERIASIESSLKAVRQKEVEPLNKQLVEAKSALSLANRKLIAREKDYANLKRLFNASNGKVTPRDLATLTTPEPIPPEEVSLTTSAPSEPSYPTHVSSSFSNSYAGYSGGRISVRGYYRKNGTYVRSHSRRR